MVSTLHKIKTQSLSMYFPIMAMLQTAFKLKQRCMFVIQIVKSKIGLPLVRHHSAFPRGEGEKKKKKKTTSLL